VFAKSKIKIENGSKMPSLEKLQKTLEEVTLLEKEAAAVIHSTRLKIRADKKERKYIVRTDRVYATSAKLSAIHDQIHECLNELIVFIGQSTQKTRVKETKSKTICKEQEVALNKIADLSIVLNAVDCVEKPEEYKQQLIKSAVYILYTMEDIFKYNREYLLWKIVKKSE
jgi:hypothetical protein